MNRVLLLLALAAPTYAWAPSHARAQAAPQAAHDRFFVTSDHVRLHWIEAGSPSAPTIVMVPGWAMPAWIFQKQIAAFSRRYHVAALDPRGQGDSQVARDGYEPGRRSQDIAELIDQLGPQPVVLLGWSLGVLDSLAYVHIHGDSHLAGLVLVDNSVGENPPPTPPPARPTPHKRPLETYTARIANFVHAMFHHKQDPAYLAQLTQSALHLPELDAHVLLSYPVPRSYWREAIYATKQPVLYLVRPGLAGQAANLTAHHADAEAVVFRDAGHALFVDEPARFNQLVLNWLHRRVWPGQG